MRRGIVAVASLLFLAAQAAPAQTLRPGRKLTTLQRLETAHLEAVHQARLRLAKERKTLPEPDVYRDIRAVMHVHAEDAAHTKGTRAQVLAAAKKAGVQVVFWSDHRGPKPESWTGEREGVLFLPGSEDGEEHRLRFPAIAGGGTPLLFLSHLEEKPDTGSNGFTGLEIYNRHTDQGDEKEFEAWFAAAMKDPQRWAALVEAMQRYPDEVFGAAGDSWPELLQRWDRETAGGKPFTGIAANDAHQNQIYNGVVFDPYEVAFRNVTTHILARDRSEAEIRKSLREGRAYVAHDWLCDPTNFTFAGGNRLGVYTMGDRLPNLPGTVLVVRTPVPARVKILKGGQVVHEATGDNVTFRLTENGVYRAEAWLEVDGELRPWIYANPIFVVPPDPLSIPTATPSEAVTVERDIVYVEGKPEDAGKHKLDLYLPKGKQNVPVLFFVHGGSWRSGDRSQYGILGQRFARAGYVVAIPSYRLAPANSHPAQIEDVAAAFAWVKQNIASRGGDPARITIAGHSAGGHLVSLLALDGRYLAAHGLNAAKDIRAVVPMSGVYVVRDISGPFGTDPAVRTAASPQTHIRADAPPFTVTYCQWDYAMLPRQAVAFYEALRRAGVEARLVYVPGENHISEIISTATKDNDPAAAALLERLGAAVR